MEDGKRIKKVKCGWRREDKREGFLGDEWKGREQGIARGADVRNGWRDWAEGEDSWQSAVIIRRLCE